jgi:hypothetical protein
MANEIKAKLGTTTQLTITLASLASNTAGGGRQSTMVDNTTTLYQLVHLYGKITTGTSPTASRGIYVYLLKADKSASPNVATDNAGASDATITIATAQQIGSILTDATSDKTYRFDAVIYNPGPSWGVAVVQDSGVSLNATAGNQAIWYVGENPEVQ